MKPYVRVAYTLIAAGMGIFMFERYGLDALQRNGTELHLGSFLIGGMALAPLVLILSGCFIFAVGTMRRPR